MIINGKDIREYGAKQLTVEIQPPKIKPAYEMMTRALLPVEYDTDIPLGTMKLTIYFIEKNRMLLERTLSSFMAQFEKSCIIGQIKGYKGSWKGFLTNSSYKKTLVLEKNILELTLEGYFFDEEETAVFDGKTSGKLYAQGSRKTPAMIEVTAKDALTNYKITLNGEAYTIKSLGAGKTIVIDGKGKVTLDGVNAFDVVDLWEFPRVTSGENEVTFSSTQAKVTIRYVPLWI